MAQVQVDSLTISIPVADMSILGPTPPGSGANSSALVAAIGTIQTHDQNINQALNKYRLLGYDLISVVFVPPGPIAPHFQLFFIKQ